MSVNNKNIKAVEGVDTIQDIHANVATNYGVWYVKKGKRKSIIKFQAAGAGGLAEVRAALDETKVQFFLYRVTGVDVKAGAKSIRSKFVRGCYTGASAPTMHRANAGIIQSDVFMFLQDAQLSFQISALADMTEDIVEAKLRAAAGAHQVQFFDFANAEARISKKSKPAKAAPAKAAPAKAAPAKAAPAAAAPAPVADPVPDANDDAADDDAADDDDTAAAPPQPASAASTDVLKLTYFDGYGRAEAIRLILKAGGVDFTDERLSFPEWGEMKADPDCMANQLFGQLPIITHGDFKLGQSRALQTYAAYLALPSTCATPKAAGIDAMFQNAHADVQGILYKCFFGTPESKEAATAKIDETVAPAMQAIERNLPDSGFIKGGDIPSAADIVVFDLGTSTMPPMEKAGVDVSKYPKFNKLVAAVGAFPAIAEYAASRS